MKYIKYTYVDGNHMPPVDGLEFVWARESLYPTSTPEFFGTCPAGSDTTVNGVLAELTEQQYSEALQQEVTDRKVLLTHRNNEEHKIAIGQMTHEYPSSEIQTWGLQRAEALAWGLDNSAATPWIDIATAARGLDRNEYLTRTLAKVRAFAAASAWLTGRRQGIDDNIRSATTLDQLRSISISYEVGEG